MKLYKKPMGRGDTYGANEKIWGSSFLPGENRQILEIAPYSLVRYNDKTKTAWYRLTDEQFAELSKKFEFEEVPE